MANGETSTLGRVAAPMIDAQRLGLSTPAALIDTARLQDNIDRMQAHIRALGVRFRPHVKTSKCWPVVRRQLAAGAAGITVSTLKEAEQFFAEGVTDILYAVGIAPGKLDQVAQLMRAGCDLKLLVDNRAAAQAVARFAVAQRLALKLLIEIDSDDQRGGLKPDDPELIEIGRVLYQHGLLAGVMTHAGASYQCSSEPALAAIAEQERARCAQAAQRLEAAGMRCSIISIGSTPTALSARRLDGITEVRAGVYVFFDLVMANVGVCALDQIALSVLTSVIGHQRDKGWAICDAGWMALSRDRGTQSQTTDYGYGQVCDVDGQPITGYRVSGTNQEHGLISRIGEPDAQIERRFPVGTLLRILPNHACATAAQFPHYHAMDSHGQVDQWPRFYGW